MEVSSSQPENMAVGMRSELVPLTLEFSRIFLTYLSPQMRKQVYHQMVPVISGKKNWEKSCQTTDFSEKFKP